MGRVNRQSDPTVERGASSARPHVSLLRYFLASSVVAIIGVTAVVGLFFVQVAEREFQSVVEQRSEAEAVHFTALFYSDIWSPQVEGVPSPSLLDLDRQTLEDFARKTAFGLGIVQINLHATDSQVVFTTAARTTEVGPPPEAVRARVIGQGLPYATLQRGQDIVYASGQKSRLDLVVTYAPLTDVSPETAEEGRLVGILEIAQDVTEQLSETRSDRIVAAVIGSTFAGLTLFAMLIVIVLRTDRRMARQQRDLELANVQAVQAGRLAAVGELVSGVAHELNNPLSGIASISRILMNRGLDSETEDEVSMIRRETERSIRIVQNLLDFARSGGSERAYVSLNDAVLAALALRRHALQVANVTLVEDMDTNLPFTMASSHEIQQVVLNLAVNAEQAMTNASNGGRLLVKTEQVAGAIRIIVSDSGPGIALEDLSRLFDPFFTTKNVGEGTGLGMSISYDIIQKHSGRLWAESEPPNGATFYVEIPIVTPAN